MSVEKKGLSYRDAGVDIDAGNRLVDRIRDDVASTRRPGVLGGLGGFGGLFELDTSRFRRPVLVGATDGVGTKLRLALTTGIHDTIGIDLVAMCVNDIIVQGAEPLFFLDYYATGRLDVDTASTVIRGIAEGCRQAGAALIGGETAELPGMYHGDDYDLAGFCVGVVEHDRLLTGDAVAPGDRLIALASSGPHSNGYSLIRRVIDDSQADLGTTLEDGQTLGSALMRPTRIYVSAVMRLLEEITPHAVAHITGGGLVENLPRVLPAGLAADIATDSWRRPPVFGWLERQGGIPDTEMWRTFNCGIGLIVAVAPDDTEQALRVLNGHGEAAWVAGEVCRGEGGVVLSG